VLYTCQYCWGSVLLYGSSVKILGMRPDLEGIEEVHKNPGPYILLMRHSSFADTVMPQYLFAGHFRMRYILKKELLYDPGIDTLGSRSPNFFISRAETGEKMLAEINGMCHLISDYSKGSNVITVLWPEGTRFQVKTRERILKKLQENVDLAEKKIRIQKNWKKRKIYWKVPVIYIIHCLLNSVDFLLCWKKMMN